MSENVVGEYTLLNMVASGGQTAIWEASHPAHPENVALKVMLPNALADRENVQVLRHEAKVGAGLEHPNIIAIHEFAASRDEAYIAMEYFRAPNVKAQLQGAIEALHARLRRVIEGTCLALDHMHSLGWIHRDLKPDNVLCNKAGEVKVIDFSLAIKKPSGLGKMFGKPKTIQGTRTYIAPETILKKHPTPATDVYSFGVMLYEMLTGTPPFLGSSPNDLLKRHLAEKPPEPSVRNPNVTDELDRVVVRLLAKKPENRPQTMGEAYNEIRNVQLFREEVTGAKKVEKEDNVGPGVKLDSRADAARTASGEAPPPKPKPAAKPKPKPKPAEPEPVPQPAAAAPQAPPGYPPQQYPYPGQPYPGQAYPPQPYPGQPYPPQGYPQGYPQYPGMPQPGYAPMLGQPMPGQQPAPPQQPAAPAPQQPAQQPQQPPAAAEPEPPAKPAENAPTSDAPPVRRAPAPTPPPDDDLPLMTELPDIK